MSERLLKLTEDPSYVLHNWREIINEIDSEFSFANTSDYRGALLQMFNTTMDIAETIIPPEDLEIFKDARTMHYKTFIVQETLVGENVCTETGYAVTQREVNAGRMLPNDKYCLSAIAAMAAPHFSRAELIKMNNEKISATGLKPAAKGLQRIFSWLTGK